MKGAAMIRPAEPGAKVILFQGRSLITILRDDLPDIPFPDHWDLPGGGIEPGETPLQGAVREVQEELGLMLSPAAILWTKTYARPDGRLSHFYAAPVSHDQIDGIVFGDEGQRWTMMPMSTFCDHPMAVPHFRARVADFLSETGR